MREKEKNTNCRPKVVRQRERESERKRRVASSTRRIHTDERGARRRMVGQCLCVRGGKKPRRGVAVARIARLRGKTEGCIGFDG